MAYLKGSSGTVTTRTLDSPVLTTPALGTPSAGVITNLTGTLTSPTFVTPALGTPASGVVTNLSGVLPSGVAGGSGLTALGTVASGNLSDNDIVMPRFKEFSQFFNATQYASQTTSQSVNISGSSYLTVTPDATGDILEFGWYFNMYIANGYVGMGIERDDNTSFSSPTVTWDTGQHALSGLEDDNYFLVGGVHHETCSGLSPGTPYYFRLRGRTHSETCNVNFGGSTQYAAAIGIRMTGKRWSTA